MQWLETIHIQTNIDQQAVVSQQLQRLTNDLLNRGQAAGLLSAETFFHPAPAGGHLLIMRWDSDDTPREVSRQGLHIKEIMNRYGLVEHTFWQLLR